MNGLVDSLDATAMFAAALVIAAGVWTGASQAPTQTTAAIKPFEEASIRQCDLNALPLRGDRSTTQIAIRS